MNGKEAFHHERFRPLWNVKLVEDREWTKRWGEEESVSERGGKNKEILSSTRQSARKEGCVRFPDFSSEIIKKYLTVESFIRKSNFGMSFSFPKYVITVILLIHSMASFHFS